MPDEIAKPLNQAKVVEFYRGLQGSPPAFIQNLIALIEILGPAVEPFLPPQYQGFVAELLAALKLFNSTKEAPIPNLGECLKYLSETLPAAIAALPPA